MIERAGGVRLHTDHHKQDVKGADYRLGSAVIELKMLDEEGLDKPERQAKLAALFRQHEPSRPVVVLGRGRLPDADRARFDRIVETPIKTAIAKAKDQLRQSRLCNPNADRSVLMVVNNGYATLDHKALKALVARRVRNDSSEIDAVIVAGIYYHSDGFDGIFLGHFDCVSIRLDRPFDDRGLHAGWNVFLEHFMTDLVREGPGPDATRAPVSDVRFEFGGVTYVRPAPAMGRPSSFYVRGRPRADSSGLTTCPTVAITFPSLTRVQWSALNNRLNGTPSLRGSYERWLAEQAGAVAAGRPLQPAVLVPVAIDEWVAWCAMRRLPETIASLLGYANDLFDAEAKARIVGAREHRAGAVVPSCYVLVETELIGQDRANDISHIALVQETSDGRTLIRSLVKDARAFHEHALAVAAAYAVREGYGSVLWQRDLTCAWV